MRVYRGTWNAALAVLALIALCVGGPRLGWWGTVGSVVMLAGLGAAFGLSWVEGEDRWRIVRLCTGWFALIGLLLVGLPNAIGGWGVLALLGLGVSSPPLVQRGLEWIRRWESMSSADLGRASDRDLERRWRRTSEQLHDRRTTPVVAMKLACERERLLDEIERRDPEAFASRLARSGWRSAGSALE